MRKYLLLLSIVAIVLASCNTSVLDAPDEVAVAETVSIAESARRAINSLPELRIKLPASLSATASSANLSSLAIGDTTKITSGSLQSVKSQAWFNLQSDGGNPFIGAVNRVFVLMKRYTAENELPENETLKTLAIDFRDTKVL